MLDIISNRKSVSGADLITLDKARSGNSRLDFIEAKLRYEYSTIKLVTTSGVELVQLREIAFIRSCSNYSIVVTSEGVRHTTSKTLKFWEGEINSPEFVRCHHSYLVNRNLIRSIDYSEGKILLKGGQHLKYSRSKKAHLMSSL